MMNFVRILGSPRSADRQSKAGGKHPAPREQPSSSITRARGFGWRHVRFAARELGLRHGSAWHGQERGKGAA